MIKVENLTKRYGELVAIDNVSFEVQRGEILGFLGPNGAGKTTTMRIITGYMPPTEGRVHVDDFDVQEYPMQAKERIGYLPENPPLYRDMSVEGYLDFVADIKKVPAGDKKSKIGYAMERCGITDVRKRLIGNLSKGYRQRIGIAQALVHDPVVLILDEPTIGLDPKQIIEIRELIKGLSGERTVILSTHILPEVTMTCTRVAIINEGKIVLEESLDRLSEKVGSAQNLFLKINYRGTEVREKILALEAVRDVEEGPSGEFIIRSQDGVDMREVIAKTVVENGWGLLELRPLTHTLEEIFLKVIST
ncbi:MAG TPA: ATP-binding cassette domain-containing protein [Thermodesulfobacteriota bacterium]|jgi:ABC-2 type transport system ATP-binding protein|nr:ATP-binding cassette domain-containing protein [Thermodesulfobacteriota bacterium]